MSARRVAVRPPLIAHIVYRLAVGGLENGLVNLINRIPSRRYRHAIICLTDCTDYRLRIEKDVPVYTLGKRAGQDFGLYVRLWRLLRELRPAVVHTRNLATLEMQLSAWLAGVPARIHGEHGRDIHDLDNTRRKYRLLRSAFRPLIHRYVVLSRDLERYLKEDVGVPAAKMILISNGVDTTVYHPNGSRSRLPSGFRDPGTVVIGSVGRMEAVKDQLTLVRAFIHLAARVPSSRQRLRLVVIGEGSFRAQAIAELENAGLFKNAWLPGTRKDVPALLRSMDIFVLPSLAEGISNTILEAMATGIPVVATDVGGNSELIENAITGLLVPRGDSIRMALAMQRYVVDAELRVRHGRAAREQVQARFNIERMVERYLAMYDAVLAGCSGQVAFITE